MKKTEIYVPVNSKKEAKQIRAILNALNENHNGLPFYESTPEKGGLYFNDHDTSNRWCIAKSLQGYPVKKITLKQLIEFLAKGNNEPKKIAVKVENEKEFKALMKYYDSLGWKSWNDHDIERSHNAGEAIDFHDNYRSAIIEIQEMDIYQIIPFSEFAEKHNIKLPLLTSEDGVDLYEGDEYHSIWKVSEGIWNLDEEMYKSFKNNDKIFINEPDEFKAFSTKQAALDWIDAQKPKEIILEFYAYKFTIKKDSVNVSHGDSDTFIDIKAIFKAWEELQ